MIISIDLDDTLYPEIEFVKSGFKAVCEYLEQEYGLDSAKSYAKTLDNLAKYGRGQLFDLLLKENQLFSLKERNKCISIYRSHTPKIELFPEAIQFLDRFSDFDKYLVTDGNVRVQRAKINVLQLKKYFKQTIPSYQYGIIHSKPSLFCFEKILKLEGVTDPSKLVYIGDNPAKDFVSLNKIGAITIRVLTGGLKNTIAKEGFDALHTVSNLDEITLELIEKLYYENRNI